MQICDEVKESVTNPFKRVTAPMKQLLLNCMLAVCITTGASANDYFDPVAFGAVGDYYLQDGSVNPLPTDDSAALQAAIDATHGNGCIYITKAFYCEKELQGSGILGIKSPIVPALYSKSKLGRQRPNAIINKKQICSGLTLWMRSLAYTCRA